MTAVPLNRFAFLALAFSLAGCGVITKDQTLRGKNFEMVISAVSNANFVPTFADVAMDCGKTGNAEISIADSQTGGGKVLKLYFGEGAAPNFSKSTGFQNVAKAPISEIAHITLQNFSSPEVSESSVGNLTGQMQGLELSLSEYSVHPGEAIALQLVVGFESGSRFAVSLRVTRPELVDCPTPTPF